MDQGHAGRGAAAHAAPIGVAGVLARLAAADGAAAHPWCRHLATAAAQRRDVGDAVHALCILHGHHPGPADAAHDRGIVPAVADWLAAAAEGFAAERGYLARLAAAAGPLPSTPGHAESHAAIGGQRHALQMLARSERSGCAVGTVAALIGDWQPIRRILDAAADRYGIAAAVVVLPDADETVAIVASAATNPGMERAIGFGAQQLFAQHRGLWSLLEARAEARDRS